MTKDNTSKSIDVGETLHRQLELLFAALNRFEESGALQHLARDLNGHQDLMRTFSGPIEELRRSGLRNLESSIGDDIRRMLAIVAETEERYRLPEIYEVPKLIQEFENIGAAKEIARYQAHASEIERAMGSMRAPWLDMADKLSSVGGFVGLQSIGHALRTLPAFDTGFTDALRVDLGDWRTD